ncbi:MAG: hypothetical protein RI920_1416 [Pseudomonadota bacterium]|jgi:hypothetical protein
MVDPDIRHPLGPKRRWFLKTAVAIGAVGASLGGLVYWHRGMSDGRLTDHGRDVFRGLLAGFVGEMLPADPAQRLAYIDTQLPKVERFINALPHMLQIQVNALLGLLSNGATRRLVTGLKTDWAQATLPELSAALESMRLNDMAGTRLVYQVLRSVTCMAFFSQSENWPLTGYPGPVQI